MTSLLRALSPRRTFFLRDLHAPRSSRPRTTCPRAFLSSLSTSDAASKWAGWSPHSEGVAVLSSVGVSRGFEKPYNQDAFLVETVAAAPSLNITSIGVLDGHGPQGHFAARTVASHFAAAIHSCAPQSLIDPESSLWWDYDDYSDCPGASNLRHPAALALGGQLADFTHDSAQACLEQTFSHAATSVQASPDFFIKSGCTAVLALILPGSVVAAWVGDSRAVVGTAEGNSYAAAQLTRDHTPQKLSELTRIVAAGGLVSRPATDSKGRPVGPYRVSLPMGDSALAVARSFGDLQLSSAGVVPTPDLAVYSRAASPVAKPTPRHPAELLVVATDGLWAVVSNQEAVDIAADAGSAEEGAAALMDVAKARWGQRFGGRHRDDITVALAWL